ncbi:unnamed protein product [Acanthosepion pharaonis]|uniref:Uncharacterized protein n=1 Tax=Acanthosepion pharaonis TaxID=158019 RepID=A0A812AS33_ACAPH|nr:unnamed protein product [Sepia pharaonis]
MIVSFLYRASFAFWVVTIILMCSVVFFGSIMFIISGLTMCITVLVYHLLQPIYPFMVPFDKQILHLHYSWCFWLLVATGIITTILGIIVLVFNYIKPKETANFFGLENEFPDEADDISYNMENALDVNKAADCPFPPYCYSNPCFNVSHGTEPLKSKESSLLELNADTNGVNTDGNDSHYISSLDRSFFRPGLCFFCFVFYYDAFSFAITPTFISLFSLFIISNFSSPPSLFSLFIYLHSNPLFIILFLHNTRVFFLLTISLLTTLFLSTLFITILFTIFYTTFLCSKYLFFFLTLPTSTSILPFIFLSFFYVFPHYLPFYFSLFLFTLCFCLFLHSSYFSLSLFTSFILSFLSPHSLPNSYCLLPFSLPFTLFIFLFVFLYLLPSYLFMFIFLFFFRLFLFLSPTHFISPSLSRSYLLTKCLPISLLSPTSTLFIFPLITSFEYFNSFLFKCPFP